MDLKLSNTLGGKTEIFKPGHKSQVNFYSCGPTVYDHAHIGNLRSYIFADIVKRVLTFNGFDVDWVMNITDVDDKTINRTIKQDGPSANPENLSAYTDRYFQLFLEDLKKINVDDQDITFVKVTEKIPDIQQYILELIKKGFAYKADDGSTYFSIAKYQEKFGDYGALVGAKFLEGKKIGARVKVDEYDKENLSDFALWKAHGDDDGQIFWDHPELGPGRPGWHIECTLINYFKFPHGTDIHTGGIDLVFPHHTNEIAQAQPIYKPFVRYWLHSEHILVDNKKMAKSAGNFFTLRDLEKENIADGLSLRYLILQSHYKSKLNVTKESLRAAKAGLGHIQRKVQQLKSLCTNKEIETAEIIDFRYNYNDGLKGTFERFKEALNNDFNTPEALVNFQFTLFEGNFSPASRLKTAYLMDEVLGLEIETSESEELQIQNLDPKIVELISKRDSARREKNFTLADQLRVQLENEGFEVNDGPEGTKLRKAT